jgi:hypothetical protein
VNVFTGLLTALIALVGVVLTIYTLNKSNKEKSIANVIALKAELRVYDDIYVKLLPSCSDIDYLKKENRSCEELGRLYSYLGLFEVAHLMIENKILTKSEFETFFFIQTIKYKEQY